MDSDVENLVRSIGLPAKRAMIPLFEAVSNSMHAIDERFDDDTRQGVIEVDIFERRDLLGAPETEGAAWPVDEIAIADNGAGFHADNLASFKKVYSNRKLGIGGKGFGRFTFLKVFADAKVESVYGNGDRLYERICFTFDAANEVQIESKAEYVGPCQTAIRLRGARETYVRFLPSDPTVVAERIIEHFLPLFALGRMPKISVRAGDRTVDLRALYDDSIGSRTARDTINYLGHPFELAYVRSYRANAVPRIVLCGNGRAVTEEELGKIATEMPERLLDENGKPYGLRVLVSGDYLDRHLDLTRTSVIFQSDNGEFEDEQLINKADLLEKIGETVRDRFRKEIDETVSKREAQLEELVREMPEYRILSHTKYRARVLRRVRFSGGRNAIEAELWRELREIESDHRAEGSQIRKLLDDGLEADYRQRLEEYTETENELGKSQLAKYIVHRRVILDLLDRSLQKLANDEKYALEQDLHNLVFPMGKTSVDIFRDQQNLWVIDEGLSFHSILASDKKMKSIPGLESTSNKEPDIIGCFYDRAITVGPDSEDATGAAVVIEFKRPKRDDFSITDPLRQITDRFFELRDGSVTSVTGRQINGKNLRFVGYFIADLTPSLKRCLRSFAHETFDGEGYYFQPPNLPAYIEVISYDRLLRNAQRRNRILFDKLGLSG
ncbi:ATP-binding protein [Achromobacter sp. UMC71]|uniref:ATP-binding protein n=1 Tax=Achromobacter sp. UMC71 TaxID=1862320 RepID=UPI0015FFF6A5|nr:ATP-binding protein [Achromobacter sp. UMC71]